MTAVNDQDMQKAYATSDLYQLLSLSLRLPAGELAEALLDGSYAQDGISILKELSADSEDIIKAEQALITIKSKAEEITSFLVEMRQEYTRLFDDPKKPAISIYETLFLRDPEDKQGVMLFMSPAALDAERCYKEAGVALVNQTAEPPDHMATELEFMMYLYAKKGKAIQGNDLKELETLNKQIRQFEELHLERWGIEFFTQLQDKGKGSIYQGIAWIGKAGLKKVLNGREAKLAEN